MAKKKKRTPPPQPGLSERLETLIAPEIERHPQLTQGVLTRAAQTAAIAWNTSRQHPPGAWAAELQRFADRAFPEDPRAAAELAHRLRETTVRASRLASEDRRIIADVRVVNSPQGMRILAAGVSGDG